MLPSLLTRSCQRVSRAVLPLLGGWLLAGPVQAQISAYTFAPSAGTFVPLPATATNVAALRTDDAVSPTMLPLGFTFVFDGMTYTSVKACSNGFLSFNPSATYNVGNTLATTAGASEKPLLAPLWDDLSGDAATSRASYETSGTAPNRVFTFEWKDWKWSFQAGSPSLSFQVKLYEGSNRVEYIYQPTAAAPAAGPSLGASVGLAGSVSGTTPSPFLSLNNLSASPTASSTTETTNIVTMPAAGQTYTFAPPTTSTCEPPTSLTVSNISANSAQISFQGRVNTTGYTVTYQRTGGAAQTVNVTAPATSTILTGLQTGSAYSVSVTASCGSQTSAAATASFTTLSGYCVSTLGGSCGTNGFTAVNVQGTSLNATGLTCTVTGGNAYTSYPATGSNTGTVQRGSTYPLSVSAAGSTSVSVWIDFNQDFVFDASEWTQVTTSATGGVPSTVNVPIQATALLGTTTMRLRSRSSGSNNGSGDACTTFGLGETKDFTITIAAPSACPAPSGLTATAITSTTATLSFTANGTGPVTLIYGPDGFNPATGGTTITNATSPVSLTNLTPATLYQFYVQQNCTGTGLSPNVGPIAFTTVPSNDEPCTAQVLTVNPTACRAIAASSYGATVANPAVSASACFGANISPRDVWYSITTAATGPTSTAVRILVSGGAASIVQGMRSTSGTCSGPFINIRCVGNTSNVAAPALDLTSLTPSTTYYVRVHTYQPNDALGLFSICATNTSVTTGAAAAITAPEWSVFPSPSHTGQLTVRLPQGTSGQVRLLNTMGQLIRQQPLSAQNAELTLSTRGLAAGLYTVQVEANGSVLSRKVVLE
ncbi:Por secretion system C-terminal sorting domain-containing protein [Hymenobacter daecheongensis DSM 21074]|uniref:Por secretion system C-terminal sorting domain-containing protein n=1 Tax=Hymenobacter daecheongensis DSM 21074 TaxID=1121955 RepID=A0A1M6GVR9_9BACT|nr:fibronectin type III domain-containing protein [Hymenobacter daecheongensis]SHJ14053.1 Por secretion system C-terminal sorting domain-containing protein [Hymenobacter daecheongensis DSM 21074]